jgi:hypothetical protein
MQQTQQQNAREGSGNFPKQKKNQNLNNSIPTAQSKMGQSAFPHTLSRKCQTLFVTLGHF